MTSPAILTEELPRALFTGEGPFSSAFRPMTHAVSGELLPQATKPPRICPSRLPALGRADRPRSAALAASLPLSLSSFTFAPLHRPLADLHLCATCCLPLPVSPLSPCHRAHVPPCVGVPSPASFRPSIRSTEVPMCVLHFLRELRLTQLRPCDSSTVIGGDRFQPA